MPVAVSTITQSGQMSVPKSIRAILGVETGDQVALLSDGKRVQLVAVPKDPLSLGSPEEFLARVSRSQADYDAGRAHDADEAIAGVRAKYGL